MKNLKEYVKEGLFDDLDKVEKIGGMESNVELLKKEVINWVTNNAKNKVSERFKFDFNTKPITVDYKGSIEFKTNITSLTNGIFQWGYISGNFSCRDCNELTSLEGAPEQVEGDFSCSGCESLKSLEGCPKEVSGGFSCRGCNKLTSLEGSTEKIRGSFDCGHCTSLESLKGAPKQVGSWFGCVNCDIQFTEADVKKVSKVKGKIFC